MGALFIRLTRPGPISIIILNEYSLLFVFRRVKIYGSLEETVVIGKYLGRQLHYTPGDDTNAATPCKISSQGYFDANPKDLWVDQLRR